MFSLKVSRGHANIGPNLYYLEDFYMIYNNIKET